MSEIDEADLTFFSANSAVGPTPKRITAFIVKPKVVRNGTGLMHFAHGWSCNRLMYADMMRDFATRYNLVCVATEFRQSGFDFDQQIGFGYSQPYDASHWQVFDCLNAVRTTLNWFPNIDRQRLISFGVSQGGHIAALMALFCPNTFAFLIDGCGISHFDKLRIEWAGRDFSAAELAARDVVAMASRFRCPVALIHGTADQTLPMIHTENLEAALRAAKATIRVQYIEGGDHGFGPPSNYHQAAKAIADDWLSELRSPLQDDFTQQSILRIPCADKILVVDWTKAITDPQQVRWETA